MKTTFSSTAAMSIQRDRRLQLSWTRPHGALLICVAALVLLAGCGGSAKPSSVTTTAQTIVFAASRALDGSDAVGAGNIWQVNPDGSGAAPVTRLTTAFSASPTWSPDGRKLIFQSSRALDGRDAANINGTENIWLVNSDGTGATPLTRTTANGVVTNGGVWSPDGRKLAFSSSRALDGSDAVNTNGTYNVWVVNADGAGAIPLTRVTANGALTLALTWSPDGTKLFFESARALDGSDTLNANATFNIWVMNSDGTGVTPLTRLTANGASSFLSKRSPDGTKLAFVSARALDGTDVENTNGTYNVWVMNPDGSGAAPLTRLTAAGVDLFQFAWSTEGGKIAFTSSRALDGSNARNTNGVHNLWLMNADGTSPVPLTRMTANQADIFALSWSVDGKKLTFDSSRALNGSDATNANATSNVWVVNLDGSNPMPLTKTTSSAAGNNAPQWKP